MKYKAGDKVKIKSLDWYNKNINYGKNVVLSDGYYFTPKMTRYCDAVLTIKKVYDIDNSSQYYLMEEAGFAWTDGMIEGLADARETPVEHPCDWLKRGLNLPDGYEFQDENGNVINASKVKIVKKKPKYPATYKECCDVLGIDTMDNDAKGYKHFLVIQFQELLIARDAYWKIAGDWKPSYNPLSDKENLYSIVTFNGEIIKCETEHRNTILTFPTSEMRDAFYENFKELIVSCKELL